MSTKTIDTASDPITFSVRVHLQAYGDNRSFHEYRIVMRLRGRVVGLENGPDRTHATSREARRAAWARISLLKTHRLYAIDVTRKDINKGEAHSCESCAIAQALYRNQERMGLERWRGSFNVAPYAGMFSTAYGIGIFEHGKDYLITGEEKMPELVFPSKRTGFAEESMMEWAMLWDEWADRQTMNIAEWRETYGKESDETPCKPWPVSFVLNLSEMKRENIR